MLTNIEIHNYKSIAHTDLEIGRETIIVGPNGVGKSNLLDAIHFVRDAVKDGLDQAITKRHGILSIRRWSKTRPFHIIIKLSFSSKEYSGDYKLTIKSAGGYASGIEEEASWTGRDPFKPTEEADIVKCYFRRNFKGDVAYDVPDTIFAEKQKIHAHDSELVMEQASSGFFNPIGLYFRTLYYELISCGAYSIYPNKIREPQAISNQEVLSDDGSNLASIIRQMRSSNHRANKNQLTEAIKQVLPIVEQIQIDHAGGFYVPVFQVRESTGSAAHNLNMSQISDGTLRMLGMLTAFYQPEAPTRITLEEPEQMIHPGLLSVLIEAGRDFLDVNDQRQVLYTTHSPIFLDMFSVDSVIAASYEDGVSSFSPMSPRQKAIVEKKLFSVGGLLVAEGIVA